MSNDLLKDIESFCAELRPIENEYYLKSEYNKDLIPLAKKYDLLGIFVDKDFGGRQVGLEQHIEAIRRIGREGSSVATFFGAHSSLSQSVLQKFGNDHIKENYLKPSTSGDKILAFALTEESAGSNPLEIKTSFKEDGDNYVIKGSKFMITNSGIADAIIIFALSEKDGKLSAFVIDAKDSSVVHKDLKEKMGAPTCNMGSFGMKDLKIPKENLLGGIGDGWIVAKYSQLNGRLDLSACSVGIMEDCLDEVIEYSKKRIQFGKEIAKHQIIQNYIADIQIAIESSLAMVEKAAKVKDEYDKKPDDLDLFKRADDIITKTKIYTSKKASEVADLAVQIFGGRGWSFWYRPGRHYADVRVHRIFEGAEEVLKLKIASDLLGKEYKAF